MNKEYLEIELDEEILAEVENLAKESKVTPFEICVTLLKDELLSLSSAQETPE